MSKTIKCEYLRVTQICTSYSSTRSPNPTNPVPIFCFVPMHHRGKSCKRLQPSNFERTLQGALLQFACELPALEIVCSESHNSSVIFIGLYHLIRPLRTADGQLETAVFINDLRWLLKYRDRVNACSSVHKCLGMIRPPKCCLSYSKFSCSKQFDPMACGDNSVEEKCYICKFGSGATGK